MEPGKQLHASILANITLKATTTEEMVKHFKDLATVGYNRLVWDKYLSKDTISELRMLGYSIDKWWFSWNYTITWVD